MIRELPEQPERVETGPTRFANDWCGVFIRGDNAFGYAMDIQMILNHLENPNAHPSYRGDFAISLASLKGLKELLTSCNERGS